MEHVSVCAGAVAASIIATAVRADVTIGPYTFDDTAFVDDVGAASGSWTLDDGAMNISDGVVGSDTDGRIWSYDAGSFVNLLFEDNVVYNGAGDDLAVFESGVLDLIAIEINGVSVVRDAVFSGDVTPTQGLDVNVATFDLSEFGIAPGESVTSVRILGGYEQAGTVSAYTVIGALNIPGPGSMMLLALATLTRIRRARD